VKPAGALHVSTPSDFEIALTREFEAPRQRVYEAYTRPELLQRWLGVHNGWSLAVCELDLRVGGSYRYVWRRAGGAEMGMRGVYREVVPGELIVATEIFDPPWYEGEAVSTFACAEQGDRTTLTIRVRYASKQVRDGVLQSPMEQGMAAGFDRLEALLGMRAGSGPERSTRPTGVRKPGEFCWINMLTPQPARAREFFARLLGWTFVEMPGMGHTVRVGGRDIGGLFDTVGPRNPNGTSPVIGVMVKVANADATCARVTALGGTALPAFDIMEAGRMAVCHDPAGAEFDVWESRRGLLTEVDSGLHGAPSWFEVLTTDVDGTGEFYRGLFSWTSESVPMPGSTYTRFTYDSTPVAGMLPITPEMGTMRPGWRTYFTVGDAEEIASEAVRLGATLCMRLRDLPGVGRSCGVTSPQGVTFCVIEYAR
jgi:hypothetical protein